MGIHAIDEISLFGDDDDGPISKPYKKRYEIAIPTQNLRWTHLARYLNLEFKAQNVQIPEDQKTVTVLNGRFVVQLPSRLTDEQKQDIDILRSSSEAEIKDFLEALEVEKLGTVPEE